MCVTNLCYRQIHKLGCTQRKIFYYYATSAHFKWDCNFRSYEWSTTLACPGCFSDRDRILFIDFIFKQNNCTFRLFPISRTSENWMYLVRTVAAALLFGGKTRNVLHWKWRVWIWNNEMWGQKPPSLSDSQKCVFTSISSGAQVDVSFPNCNKLPANRKMCTFPGNKKKSDTFLSYYLLCVDSFCQVGDDLTLVTKTPGGRSQNHIHGSCERETAQWCDVIAWDKGKSIYSQDVTGHSCIVL